MNEDEKIKLTVKDCLSIREDYNIYEIIEALLLNDLSKLDKMTARCHQLKSAYNFFAEEIDSGDEDRKKIAISSFKRPEK